MTAIIYHAFDTTNGKAYVGQTWDTLEQRRKLISEKTRAAMQRPEVQEKLRG